MTINQNEKRARDAFKSKSQGIIHIEGIENMLSEATADAICINRNGVAFWVEFKHLDDWPKRDTTLPLRRSFEKGQLPFLKQWQSWKGLAYVLLKVGNEWYLLMAKGVVGMDKGLDEQTEAEIKSAARCTGVKSIIEYLGGLH